MIKHLWVRLMAALSLALFTTAAFAADVVTDISQGPVQHPVLAIVAAASATLTRMLQSDVSWFPSRLLRWRLVIILGLSTLGSWIDMVQHGTGYTAALYAIGLTAVPSLVVEIFHLFSKGGKGGSGSSSPDLSDAVKAKPEIPPPATNIVKVEISITPTQDPSRVAQAVADRLGKLRRFPVAVAALAVALAVLPGCGAGTQKILNEVGPILTTAITDVQDATQVLEVVQSVVDVFFLARPAPEAQMKVEKALGAAHLALDAASRATSGAQSLTQGQSYAAFQKFVLAFKEVQTLLGQLGITDNAGRVGATPGGEPVSIPVPLVVGRAQS